MEGANNTTMVRKLNFMLSFMMVGLEWAHEMVRG